MREWMQWLVVFTICVAPACGGGKQQVEEPEPCGQVLGEETVQPLLEVHQKQIMIEVRFVTIDDAFLRSLGVMFPNALPIQEGQSLGSLAGSFCGGTAGVATTVVGGAEGDRVMLPQGTSGSQGLPRIEDAPLTPTNGSQVFPTMPGPGVFDVAIHAIQVLDLLNLIAASSLITPLLVPPGGNSLIYALTDDSGFNQFLTEAQGDAGTRIVSAPKIVTLENQEATIFVGTERPTVNELTSPIKEGVQAANPDAQFAEVGVTLHVTPRIVDPGFIQLTLRPAWVTSVVDSPQLTFGGGSPIVVRTPVLHPSDQKVDLLMSDGNTAILGGLRDNTTMAETFGLPILGTLPVIGAFVLEHRQLDLRDDLIVLIRAHVVRNDP